MDMRLGSLRHQVLGFFLDLGQALPEGLPILWTSQKSVSSAHDWQQVRGSPIEQGFETYIRLS
jgi:hypothetical protein